MNTDKALGLDIPLDDDNLDDLQQRAQAMLEGVGTPKYTARVVLALIEEVRRLRAEISRIDDMYHVY
jgi:hypothetical protein